MGDKIQEVSRSIPNQLEEARFWKALDNIAARLTNIDLQLTELVRLEERVNGHENALKRYGGRLDRHDRRIRDTELWQANHGDSDSVELLIVRFQKDLETLKNKDSKEDGQKDVVKELLKWFSLISVVYIAYLLKN